MGSDLEALERADAGFLRAAAASDTRWFEEHLAADFLNGGADGSLADKAAFLSQVARPFTLADFACEDVRVRIWDGFAVLHGRTTYRAPSGEPRSRRYADAWMRRERRWLCVAAHVTRG